MIVSQDPLNGPLKWFKIFNDLFNTSRRFLYHQQEISLWSIIYGPRVTSRDWRRSNCKYLWSLIGWLNWFFFCSERTVPIFKNFGSLIFLILEGHRDLLISIFSLPVFFNNDSDNIAKISKFKLLRIRRKKVWIQPTVKT